MPVPKRARPPNINLSLATQKREPIIQLEPESPLEVESPLELSDNDDLSLQLSLQSSSVPILPNFNLSPPAEDNVWEDLSKDLAALEQLRKSVQTNLRLRPIRSHSALPKVTLNTDIPTSTSSSFLISTVSRSNTSPLSAISPPNSSVSSYFTPLSEVPLSEGHPSSPLSITPSLNFNSSSRPIDPKTLYTRLSSSKRPLLIDTRPPSTHISFHFRHSINIAIPSLILKRCRKPGGGFQSLDALRQFITTEGGRQSFDEMISSDATWDGDVVIYDDEMDPKDRDNVAITAWALISLLTPLVPSGHVDYLQGGISAAGHHPDLQSLVISGGELGLTVNSTQPPSGGMKKDRGLSQLDTPSAFRSKVSLEFVPPSTKSNHDPSLRPRSPLPLMPGAMNSSIFNDNTHNIMDPTPSPPPSQVSFRRPHPPRGPSVPSLRRLDTKSAEPLNGSPPKLSLQTRTVRSATLAVPPSHLPTSPSHLNLVYSNHSPPGSARWTPATPSNDPSNYLTPYYTPPHTPGTPKPPSPPTARPELDPPTTEEAFPVFSISTILPNFLYLGPELTDPEHVEELQDLGVKRILNIAAECDDDNGLMLKEVFDKYYKIPMRDIVEEENIARGVKEVCEILGTHPPSFQSSTSPPAQHPQTMLAFIQLPRTYTAKPANHAPSLRSWRISYTPTTGRSLVHIHSSSRGARAFPRTLASSLC
jgi:hypothetical protein